MNIIFFIVLSPLIGFLFLSSAQGLISYSRSSKIGILSVLISFFMTCIYAVSFIQNSNPICITKLFSWIYIQEFNIDFSFLVDGLSFSMLFVITGVGLLIHIFASWYMKMKEGSSRFFAYTNLFIASMLVLVLADNFLFMFLGWEGVSVCSYLLIGFYYTESKNNYYAIKAFILTRISDIFLMIGMFLVYKEYSTFNFQEIKFLSTFLHREEFYHLNIITLCLLISVLGKSAQIPLHTWLSDAMVGPTPVSALIHAATMVTAGVYLIARTHFLFLLTPDILYLISLIGIFTIFFSSISALVQTDIKRILAYSTMSQIGYMFLALGVQAWTAAIIHLIMHAIFKALLFLSSGSLIISCNNQKNIFKMGGLRKKIPWLYINFIVGGASLASFPLISAGFYSKGNILFSVLQSGHINLFLIALFCSFLTSVYTFRMIFVVFHGESHLKTKICSYGLAHNTPLFILLFFSTFFGSYILPPLSHVFPSYYLSTDEKFLFEIISSLLSISGICLAYYLWIQNKYYIDKIFQFNFIKYIYYFLLKGWGFDHFYNIFFVKLYLHISSILSSDPFNKIIFFLVKITKIFNVYLLKTNNGYIRSYITSIILGINFIFFIVFFY